MSLLALDKKICAHTWRNYKIKKAEPGVADFIEYRHECISSYYRKKKLGEVVPAGSCHGKRKKIRIGKMFGEVK